MKRRKGASGPVGQELLKQRKVRAEGVFALAKEQHGLRRTRFMGRWKVQMRLRLTAGAVDIKKPSKALQSTRIGDNDFPDGSVPGLSTLAGFAEDITAPICHFLSRLPAPLRRQPQRKWDCAFSLGGLLLTHLAARVA